MVVGLLPSLFYLSPTSRMSENIPEYDVKISGNHDNHNNGQT